MTHTCLTRLGPRRDGEFYLTALGYAQHLWRVRRPARAILAATRGLYCPLSGDEPELIRCPWPYAAIGWMIQHAPPDVFLGNPRISFQHQAGRMRGDGQRRRVTRAWAVWHIVRKVAPELPGDPTHAVHPLDREETASRLERWGAPGERAVWEAAWAEFNSPRS